MWLVYALGWAMWKLLRSRGRVCLPWPRSSPSPWFGRGGDRRLRPGRSPSPGVGWSPSPGSGGAEFAVFRGLARVRALGRAERSFLWRLWQGLTACQSHSVEWHCSRSGAGGAVLLSDRSVERRSDCGHFGSAGARVRIEVSGHLCVKCSCNSVSRCGDLVRVAS